MNKVHRIQTTRFDVMVSIADHPDKIVVNLQIIKQGHPRDQKAISALLGPILAPHFKDPRPLVFTNPLSGEKITAFDTFAIIEPPNQSRN